MHSLVMSLELLMIQNLSHTRHTSSADQNRTTSADKKGLENIPSTLSSWMASDLHAQLSNRRVF